MSDNVMMLIFSTAAIFVTSCLTYIGLSAEIMSIYAFLLLADFISGTVRALVREEKVSYITARNGIIVKMLLWFIPIILACTAKVIGVEAQYVFEWGIGLLAFTEGYSFASNTYYIKRGKYLPKIDGLAILGELLRKWLRIKLSKWEEDNDDKRQNQNV